MLFLIIKWITVCKGLTTVLRTKYYCIIVKVSTVSTIEMSIINLPCGIDLIDFFLNYLFIYFLFVLGLRFCARAFSICGARWPLFIAVRGPLTIAASLVAEHRLQTRRLSSCGSRA